VRVPEQNLLAEVIKILDTKGVLIPGLRFIVFGILLAFLLVFVLCPRVFGILLAFLLVFVLCHRVLWILLALLLVLRPRLLRVVLAFVLVLTLAATPIVIEHANDHFLASPRSGRNGERVLPVGWVARAVESLEVLDLVIDVELLEVGCLGGRHVALV